MSESTAIIILLASFLIMVFLRFPIAYSVAISTLMCLSYMGLPLATLTQQMVKGISSFCSTFLHHHGRTDGIRRYIGKTAESG